MPAQPLTVTLSDGQKIEAMKRFRVRYAEELAQVEGQLVDILTNLQEADFLGQYLGEQPEVGELRKRQGEVEKLEKRRAHLTALIERLDQYTPKQPEVKATLGGEAQRPAAARPSGVKRY
jgi:t-SNARE complex subunit (syntaxin)